MEITVTVTDDELNNLINWVQVETWRIEMGDQERHGLFVMAERILAAASSNSAQPNLKGSEPAALEYAGKYFAMKAATERLEGQNAHLMQAVQQMAHRASLMQSALIEAGLVSKIPPPARLLESEWSQSPVATS